MTTEASWDDTVPGQRFKIDEPIEIRISRSHRLAGEARKPYVLCCWVDPHGTIGYSLQISGAGMPEALSNLGSNGIFPHKAVANWQVEVINFVADNRHGNTIQEVR